MPSKPSSAPLRQSSQSNCRSRPGSSRDGPPRPFSSPRDRRVPRPESCPAASRGSPKTSRPARDNPKSEPGAMAVQTVRQPGEAAMVFKQPRVGIVGGPRVQGAHQTKCQNRQRQPGQAAGQQSRQRMPMARFRGGMNRKIFPAQRRISFWPADEKFYEQQNPQRVTGNVHGPDRPRLGRAKRPGTENQHREISASRSNHRRRDRVEHPTPAGQKRPWPESPSSSAGRSAPPAAGSEI